MKESYICSSEKELIEFAAAIGCKLCGKEVFALVGDLGLGKTTFVKGLAKGLGSPAHVTSPTFNLVHRYLGGRLPLFHYDLYRLKKLEEIEALDLEAELEGHGVIAIEWPQLVQKILPPERTYWVHFEEINPSSRQLAIQSLSNQPNLFSK